MAKLNFDATTVEPTNRTSAAFAGYEKRLRTIPPPGKGAGCHLALLGAATCGVMAGLDGERIFRDIREAIPEGTRTVPDREILDAVRRARSDTAQGSQTNSSLGRITRRPEPPPAINPVLAWAEIHDAFPEACMDDLVWHSPVPIPEGQAQAGLLLKTLYAPDEVLYLGTTYGRRVTEVSRHLRSLRQGVMPPHIAPNPLTGQAQPTRSGLGLTRRGDNCVAAYRFAVVEFDDTSIERQAAFWLFSITRGVPVAAVIHSGGKSLHGWFRLANVGTPDDWDVKVKHGLYARWLVPLGADRSCAHPSRLSRLPGHIRWDTGNMQRLLYLSPDTAASQTGCPDAAELSHESPSPVLSARQDRQAVRAEA